MTWLMDAIPCKFGVDSCRHPECFEEHAEHARTFYALTGDPVWHCKDGTRLKYSSMETSHVRNCIAMAKRGYDAQGTQSLVKAKTLARLEAELAFRESAHLRLQTTEQISE